MAIIIKLRKTHKYQQRNSINTKAKIMHFIGKLEKQQLQWKCIDIYSA